MERKRRIILVAAVVAVAAGSGHLMQRSPAAAKPQAIVPLSATAPAEPALPAVTPPAPVLAAVPAETPAEMPVEEPALAAAPDCTPALALTPLPAARVALALAAPCRGAERVVIRHAGLAVTGHLSPAGMLAVSLPALQSPAQVSVLFGDGDSAASAIAVPDLSDFDRFAVQWPGDDAFQLQAYADDADFGAPGHVSALHPGLPSAAGHFVTALGDPTTEAPLLAEVYTFPAGTRAGSPGLRLDIEAAVTEATCDREILGETLQLAGGDLVLRELTLAMPGCDAVGDILVLPNPLADLKLAAHEG